MYVSHLFKHLVAAEIHSITRHNSFGSSRIPQTNRRCLHNTIGGTLWYKLFFTSPTSASHDLCPICPCSFRIKGSVIPTHHKTRMRDAYSGVCCPQGKPLHEASMKPSICNFWVLNSVILPIISDTLKLKYLI